MRHRRSTGRARVLALSLLAAGLLQAHAAAPVIYRQPALQSPVSGAPDDLLLLAGSGFSRTDRVFYADPDDGRVGIASVVSYENAPDSLTIKLPAEIVPHRIYALWVETDHNELSNRVLINDSRPLWFTPSQVFERALSPQMSRQLKIVGRNLGGPPGDKGAVRLSGPETIVRPVQIDEAGSESLRDSVAVVELPPRLQAGQYAVSFSRDGVDWTTIAGLRLRVKAAARSAEFSIAAAPFGGCRPDDGRDDTRCLIAAIHAAQAAGGTVTIPPGVWNFSDAQAPGTAVGDGIVVPAGVSLRGAGRRRTTLSRSAFWNGASVNAFLTLQGNNTISRIRFKDERIYAAADPPSRFVQLGIVYYRRSAHGPASIDDVSIVDNIFDRVSIAIADGGVPIRRLMVSRNEFGAYRLGLALGGDRSNVSRPFQLEDSVISHNVFKPGSYLDLGAGQGAAASMIGASTRLDFSHNTADGAANEYLYQPTDASGWRAAFFWHMNNNHEMTLIAQNTVTCSGDKDGDGEAIAWDNNANTFAFERARDVVAAGAAGVSVAGPPQAVQNDRKIDAASYYVGHWMQVVAGPGVGQARKIQSVRIDAQTGVTSFTVSPDWDVPPQPKISRVTVGREFWQVYALDNEIDQRQPLCRKSNRTKRAGGRIAVWAQTSDSVIAGNKQYDTDGIVFHQSYSGADSHCPTCSPGSFLQSFLYIHDNLIDGEYDWNSDCSRSGIEGSHSAAPTPDSPPPVVSYGVSIAHNVIRHADGYDGGAITVPVTWFRGPPPNSWPVVNNLLIYHNAISDIDGASPGRSCGTRSTRRVGIHLGEGGLVWRAVLYGNTCTRVGNPLQDDGVRTTRVCPGADANSCDCTAREVP